MTELEKLIDIVKPNYETRCRLFDIGKKSGMVKVLAELRIMAQEKANDLESKTR